MKKSKKRALISLILGGAVFCSAAVATLANSNGYGIYKNALKNLLMSRNHTMVIKAYDYFDGEKKNEVVTTEKVNLDGDAKLHRVENTDDMTYEEYFQDGHSITKHTWKGANSEKYEEDPYLIDDYISDQTPQTMASRFTGTAYYDDKTSEKFVRFMEIAADLVTGDLKNNFIYEGEQDNIHTYSITLDSFQIPEIISSGIDLITSLNNSSYDVEDLKERVEYNYTGYLYQDIVIDNLSAVVKVDDDGNIRDNNVTINVSGNDWDGNAHTWELHLDLSCCDYGTTQVDRLDTESLGDEVQKMSEYYKRTSVEETEEAID